MWVLHSCCRKAGLCSLTHNPTPMCGAWASCFVRWLGASRAVGPVKVGGGLAGVSPWPPVAVVAALLLSWLSWEPSGGSGRCL